MDILETAISKPRLVSYKPLVISLVSDRAGGFRGNFSEKHGTGGCCQLEQMIIPRARVHDPDGVVFEEYLSSGLRLRDRREVSHAEGNPAVLPAPASVRGLDDRRNSFVVAGHQSARKSWRSYASSSVASDEKQALRYWPILPTWSFLGQVIILSPCLG